MIRLSQKQNYNGRLYFTYFYEISIYNIYEQSFGTLTLIQSNDQTFTEKKFITEDYILHNFMK